MSMKPPYCEIHGLVCTDVIQSVEVDGADLKVSTHATPGKRFAEVLEQGRNPRKITLKARFLTEADLDEWIAHVNAAPEDCEVYPFRDDRCAYVKYAHAQVTDSEPASINGEYTTFHKGKATLHTKEPWVFGAEKGVLREVEQVLPAAATIQHAGTVNALTCLDKLTMRGSFRWKRPARLISAASDTVIAVVRDDDSIQLAGVGIPAIELPKLPLGVSPVSIAAQSENMLWAVGDDDNLYTWDPATLGGLSWNLCTAQSISIAKLSVATDGTMAAMADDGKIYVWSGGSWVEYSGKTATDIFCMAANEIYIVESDTNCWKHNGSSWSQISNTPALSRVSGTRDGTKQICALSAEGHYLILSGSAWGLDDLGGGAELAVININKVFFIGGLEGDVYVQYAPAPLIDGRDQIITYLEDFYATNVALSFTPASSGVAQQLILCSKLMRSDIFEVDRYGNIEHRYETGFDLSFSDFQADLGRMPDYTPHTAWCSISNSRLTINNNGRVIFPFHGPMAISSEKPYIEFNATAISSGGPRVVVGHAADQSDLVEVPANLHLGYNKIWMPNQEGQTDLLLGFIERRCWVQVANMITPRGWAIGGGNDESALVASGTLVWDYTWHKINNPEEFNGTAWAIANSLAVVRVKAAGDGNGSDGICFGGLGGYDNTALKSTEEYNGTSWSAGGDLCTVRYWHSGGGGSADAISVYGQAAYPQFLYTEVYNGTAWATDATTLFLGSTVGRGGGGDSGDAIVSGGVDAVGSNYYAQVEHYNGTAWDGSQGRLSTARRDLVSRTTLAFGGHTGYFLTSVTEEFDGSVWVAGSHLITPRGMSTGGGGYLSGICAGGLRAVLRSDMHDGCQNTETYGRNGAIELEDLKAVVRRYIDPAEIPTVDPGDEFELKIDAGGAQQLEYLELYFRDAWWL